MDDETEPPERIAHLVEVTPYTVRFPSAKRQWFWIAVGLLGGAFLPIMAGILLVAVSVLTGARGLDSLGGALMMPSIFFTLIGGFFGYLGSQRKRDLVVSARQATYQGLLAPRPVRAAPLHLSGDMGRPMELWSENEKIGVFRYSSRSRGFDFGSVTWLAKRIAALQGVELVDDRPAEDWARWESDSSFRARIRWDRSLEENEREMSEWHAHPPTPPPHKVGLENMRILLDTGLFSDTILKLDATHLHLHDRSYRLDEIHRAGVFFEVRKTKNSRYYAGRLKILIGDRVKSIARMQVRHSSDGAGELLWVAEEIQRLASTASAPRDEGSVADVPTEMAQMLRPQPETP